MATFYFNGAVNGDWNTLGNFANYSIAIYGAIFDTATLTINGVTFEFDNDNSITEGNIAVNIGNDIAETMLNLKPLIEANLNVVATVDGQSISIVSNIIGPAGNFTVSTYNIANRSEYIYDGYMNWWNDDTFTTPATSLPTNSDSVIAVTSITSNSGTEPTITNFTMSGSYIYLDIPITVTGTATFNGDSYNSGTVTGNVTYNGLTGYVGGENIYYVKGEPSSLDSNGDGNWNGLDYLSGIAETTLYYNSAVDTDWNNLNNWWSDSGVTNQATFLPRSIDSVVFVAGSQCLSNNGSQPTVKNLTLN